MAAALEPGIYRVQGEGGMSGARVQREGRQGRGWIIYIDHDTKIYDYKQLGEDEGLWKYGNCNQHPAAPHPPPHPAPLIVKAALVIHRAQSCHTPR